VPSGPVWRARRISTAVLPILRAPGAPGYVHSVFARAVNLVVDEQLVTLADASVGGLPNGVVFEVGAEVSLVEGAAVRREGEMLLFGSGWARLDLRPAVAWSPELPRGLSRLPWTLDDLRLLLDQSAATAGFWPLLRRLISPAAPLSAMCARALPSLTELAEAQDLPRLLDAARGLVGLGDGLTPSGDDLLVGFSAGLRATADPLAERFARGCADLARGRTTLVAQMFLDHAARGAYSERVQRLVSGSPTDARAWGASSGADTLLGILLASYTTLGESIQLTLKRAPLGPGVSFTSVPV
jgi:hypothetical protein